MLCYYFPPLGMGGSQRVAKFAKYLSKFGWQPVVVAVKRVAYHAEDSSLLDDVKGVEVHRSGSLDPQRILAILADRKTQTEDMENTEKSRERNFEKPFYFVNRLANWLFVPDNKILWLPFALAKTWQILPQGAQVFFTSSPPHSVHFAGLILKKLTGLPWVADFRDDWTGGEFQPCPSRLHLKLNRALERYILRHADAVTCVSRGLARSLAQKSGRPPNNFQMITNGYDAAEFENRVGAIESGKFTITHCGAISRISDPEMFLQALASLFAERPELKEKIRVNFVGLDLTGKLVGQVTRRGLQGVVSLLGYVSHREALRYLTASQVLLLLISPGVAEGFIPGKTFEYLGSRKPIFAIAPKGEAAELIERAGAATVVVPGNVSAIQRAIERLFTLFEKGELPSGDPDYVWQFERQQLTRKLAQTLDAVVNRSACQERRG